MYVCMNVLVIHVCVCVCICAILLCVSVCMHVCIDVCACMGRTYFNSDRTIVFDTNLIVDRTSQAGITSILSYTHSLIHIHSYTHSLIHIHSYTHTLMQLSSHYYLHVVVNPYVHHTSIHTYIHITHTYGHTHSWYDEPVLLHCGCSCNASLLFHTVVIIHCKRQRELVGVWCTSIHWC